MPIANYPFLHGKERHLGHRCPIWRAGMWLTNSSQLTTGLGIQIIFILAQTDDYFYDSRGPKVSVRVTFFVRPGKKRFHRQKAVLCLIRELHHMLLFSLSPCFQGGNSILTFAVYSYANSSRCVFSVLFNVTHVLWPCRPPGVIQRKWFPSEKQTVVRMHLFSLKRKEVRLHIWLFFLYLARVG